MNAVNALHALPQSPMTAGQIAQIMQAERRALVREILRTVPASEPAAIFELPMLDGSLRQVTRGALSERIQHGLRPRMRRIVERQLIAHRSREQVAKELGVSIKTLERDSQAALDLLISALIDTGDTGDTGVVGEDA